MPLVRPKTPPIMGVTANCQVLPQLKLYPAQSEPVRRFS